VGRQIGLRLGARRRFPPHLFLRGVADSREQDPVLEGFVNQDLDVMRGHFRQEFVELRRGITRADLFPESSLD
jgi:hypothetical protein